MKYWRIISKCMACGFHFIGLTWHLDEWKDRKAYCPECGKQNVFVLKVTEMEGQIYEEC